MKNDDNLKAIEKAPKIDNVVQPPPSLTGYTRRRAAAAAAAAVEPMRSNVDGNGKFAKNGDKPDSVNAWNEKKNNKTLKFM